MLNGKKAYKILAPIAKKDGGTYWMRVGTGYRNKDDSINAYMDAYPIEGKLQIRELTEEDFRERDGARRGTAAPGIPMPAAAAAASTFAAADGPPF